MAELKTFNCANCDKLFSVKGEWCVKRKRFMVIGHGRMHKRKHCKECAIGLAEAYNRYFPEYVHNAEAVR